MFRALWYILRPTKTSRRWPPLRLHYLGVPDSLGSDKLRLECVGVSFVSQSVPGFSRTIYSISDQLNSSNDDWRCVSARIYFGTCRLSFLNFKICKVTTAFY